MMKKYIFLFIGLAISWGQAQSATFAERCANPDVVFCFGFDDIVETQKGFYAADDPNKCSDNNCKSIDTSIKASGQGSLRMEIPSNTSSSSSGGWRSNFSKDNAIQFGEGEEFFVQWRQRFSDSMINTVFQNTSGAGGWKTVIIGEGDRANYNAGSCTKLEVVLNNYEYRGIPQGYVGCGSWRVFEKRFGAFDFQFQNMVDNGAGSEPYRYCLYSTATNNAQRPVPGCFPFVANDWMTFQVRIKVGNWGTANSEIELWASKEGGSSVHLVQIKDMIIDQQSANSKYGKVWFLPYNTSKDPAQAHEIAYTWYDDLVVSRSKIGDPTSVITPLPSSPEGLQLEQQVK